jgi:hypothetical protein
MMKSQSELLPRPHCKMCDVDMWLVETLPTKTRLVQMLTFQCPACSREKTTLLDIATNQERNPRELVEE